MNCYIRLKNIVLASICLTIINLLGLVIIIPIYVQLLVQSLSIIYIACFLSHELFELWNAKLEKNGLSRIAGKQQVEDEDKPEIMSMKDAYMFPVYGFPNCSLVLFGLYIFCKYISKDLANWVLGIYFTFLGLLSLMSILNLLLQPYCQSLVDQCLINKKIKIFGKELNIKFNKMELLTLIIGAIPTLAYFFTKHWLLNNLFGVAFSIIGIKTLVIPNFKIGSLLLLGLFFYDIFWVYGTDVMITVATSIDAPIKLFFPTGNEEKKFSIIGLGDIVLPGVLLSLALKFDLENAIKNLKALSLQEQLPTQTKYLNAQIKSTPYFTTACIGYALGIVATFVAMTISKKGQPALLFLVPACCGSLLLVAFIQKQLPLFLSFEDGNLLKEYQENENKTTEKENTQKETNEKTKKDQ